MTLHSDTATVQIRAPQDLPPLAPLPQSVDALVPWNPRVVVVHTVGSQVTD